MTERIDAILEQQEQALKLAVAKAMKAMNEAPTTANVRAYQAASKALAGFQREQGQESAAERLPNLEQAAAWLIQQGFLVSARTVRNHADRVAGFPRKQKDGSYLQAEVLDYARRAWENPSQPLVGDDKPADHADAIKRETARKLQMDNDIKAGHYLLRSSEEQRDAAVLAGFRRHLESSAPERLQALLAEIGAHLPDGVKGIITARQPEYLQRDLDFLADMFDGFVRLAGEEKPESKEVTR